MRKVKFLHVASSAHFQSSCPENSASAGSDGPDTTDYASRLTDQGVEALAACRLAELLRAGRLAWSELNSETFAVVSGSGFPETALINALKEFEEAADGLPPGLARTVALNCALNAWRESAVGPGQAAPRGPSEASLKRLLQRTGFSHEVTAGQRRYGPPPGRQREPPPPPSCEVFLGRLPPDAFEDSLVPLLEEAGPLFDLRLPIEPATGFNRGFAFALFTCPGDAARAAELLNGRFIDDRRRDSQPLQVQPVAPTGRLLVSDLPKLMTVGEIRSKFEAAGLVGLTAVVCYGAPAAISSVPSGTSANPGSSQSAASNRGFCFLEFASHADAAAAKKRLLKDRGSSVFSDGTSICVDWADPVEEEDREMLSQLRMVLIRGLAPAFTEADLRRRLAPFGPIDSVTRTRDLGMACFRRREDALRAVAELDGVENLEVSLARRQAMPQQHQPSGLLPQPPCQRPPPLVPPPQQQFRQPSPLMPPTQQQRQKPPPLVQPPQQQRQQPPPLLQPPQQRRQQPPPLVQPHHQQRQLPLSLAPPYQLQRQQPLSLLHPFDYREQQQLMQWQPSQLGILQLMPGGFQLKRPNGGGGDGGAFSGNKRPRNL